MKIGIIQGKNPSIHSGYYFAALSYVDEIELVSNKQILDYYGWFPGNKQIEIKKNEDIESDPSFDYVLYGWNYLKEGQLNSKSPRGIFVGMDKIYWFERKMFLDDCDICFKLSCPIDKEILSNEEKRPYPYNKYQNLNDSDIEKIKPLMYIGTSSVDYDFPLSSKQEIDISFVGSITSKNRIETVRLVKEKFKEKFVGGFSKDSRAGPTAYDERGFDIINEDVSGLETPRVQRDVYFEWIANSKINLSPAGWGASSHRWVDILCAGGFCLSCDLSHLDHGPLAPQEGIHYISYKNDMSDLIEKIEYYLEHPDETKQIRKNARKHMEETYLQPKKMAETYILKYLK